MTYTPTILVLENFATFEHNAYNPKTTFKYWEKGQDLPKEGLPKRPEGGINRSSIDHGALVLNRLVGNQEILYSESHSGIFTLPDNLQKDDEISSQSQKAIGTAPEGTNIIYAYITNSTETKDSHTTLFSIMKDHLESKKTRTNFLKHIHSKIENKEIKLDAISMSDSFEELNNPELMEIEMLDKAIALITMPARILKQKDIDQKRKLKAAEKLEDNEELKNKLFSNENETIYNELRNAIRSKSKDLRIAGQPSHFREILKDKNVQISCQSYINYMQEHINNLYHDKKIDKEEFQYMGQLLTEGGKAIEYNKEKDEFPYFQRPEFKPLLNKGKEIYSEYSKIKAQFNKKNIPVFTVDMAIDYDIEVHGLNLDGTVNKGNEDSRRPKKLTAKKTFLLPNQQICSPCSYKTNNEMYNDAGRGGISSLVPAMTGIFAQARSIDPKIKINTFINELKLSATSVKTDSNIYGGYKCDDVTIKNLQKRLTDQKLYIYKNSQSTKS